MVPGFGPVSQRQRLLAFAVVVAMIVAIISVAPAFSRPLGVVPAFFTIWTLAFVGFQLLTAAFLFVRSRVDRSLASAVLCGTYVFCALLVAANTLALPGVGGLDRVLGIGATSAGFCWAFLHFAFPLGIALAALCEGRRSTLPSWLPVVSAIALAALAIVVAYALGAASPRAMFGLDLRASLTLVAIAQIVAASGAIVVSCRAGAALTSLRLWIAIALVALILDTFLTAITNERYTVAWYAARLLSATAGSVVLVAIATEATEALIALRARLAGQEGLRELAGSIPHIIFTARPSGIVDWGNARWFAYTGLSEGEAFGRGWLAVHHPAEIDELKRRWHVGVATGHEFESEFRLRGADGAFRWFSCRIVPLRDEDGAVVRWYGSLTDIDEKRRQATHLRDLYAREHRIASALQTAFLPATFPECRGLAFSNVYNPAAEDANVGGDWYDVFTLTDGRVAVCVGDVSGHGLDAAVRMLRAREVVRAAAIGDATPSRVLAVAARAIGNESDQFITALFGVVDRQRGTFRYASAGHPPPALLQDGRSRILPYGGMPLGIDSKPEFEDHTFDIGEGDVLALYTDGLIESTRDTVDGECRLLSLLDSGVTDAASIALGMLGERQQDDVAVATIAVGPRHASDARRPGWLFHAGDAADARGSRPSFALYLRACGVAPDDIALAELVFGELLGNVVRHAPGPVDIGFAWQGHHGRLRFADRGAGIAPRETVTPSPFAESGRGWLIIETLGITPAVSVRAGGGTEVVVDLPFSPREPAAPAAPFEVVVPLRSA